MKAQRAGKDFPVVCVGGSVGGLDAYTRLLRQLPADMGVAIVIVNHMRTQATQLHEVLPRYTEMPVELITDRLRIQPNHVFIIPAQRDLHVLRDEFRLKPLSKPRGWSDVITVFLRSLTRHWDGKLIAVIVSGYDADGAAALCGIKEVGGITIAQKLGTAWAPDMPASAIATGCIDFVLSPEEIAQEIVRIAHAADTDSFMPGPPIAVPAVTALATPKRQKERNNRAGATPMLTPFGTLLSQDLGDRGWHLLDTRQGLPREPQLDLACRTILAVLLTFQPDRSAPKAKRDAFKTICDGVQVWLKGEIAEVRRAQPPSKRTASKAKPRQRVGHA